MILAAGGLVAGVAQAQLYLNTFDNSGSIGVSRFDYSSANSSGAVSWSSSDAQNNPSSGSQLMTYTLNTTLDGGSGGAKAAITMDLFYPGRDYVDLSFDLMVGPGSATDAYGGYGYFGVATRLTDGYNYNGVWAHELGPSWDIPLTPGTWVHVDIPLTVGVGGTGTALRALTFQQYSDSGRNINGTDYISIDNLQLTPVPEPSALALLLLGIPAGLIFRARRAVRG